MPSLPFTRSLSARLLLLTILFVMLAEVLIFVPSVARFRLSWLEQRLAEGHLAALSVEVAPDAMVGAGMQAALLDQVGAYTIDLIRPDKRVYMLGRPMPGPIDERFDLRTATTIDLIADAFGVLARPGGRTIEVIGHSPKNPDYLVEAVLNERPLHEEIIAFGWRILLLSLVISLITASLVFFTLQCLLVQPMQQLTRSVMAFHRDPEDPSAIVVPSRRSDEIGLAQKALAGMQEGMRTALRQRQRLATLGTAVTKINHDLRAILATATLITEHLGNSADPDVRRIAPRLMTSLDRAIDLCTQTLSYARDGVVPLQRSCLSLHAVLDEVGAEVLETARRGRTPDCQWINNLSEAMTVDGDRAQLYRALLNLGRNAVEAGATTVTVDALTAPSGLAIQVIDNGPGLPPHVRETLFQPFAERGRSSGSGLGLAIAKEVAVAHGGDLRLERTGPEGTVFVLNLPHRALHT